jgi:hypothetical protein
MMWSRPISPNELEMNNKDFCSWHNATNERVKVCPLFDQKPKVGLLLLQKHTISAGWTQAAHHQAHLQKISF